MKFEEKLRIELVPEWREFYLNYEHLKRMIYEVERVECEAPLVNASFRPQEGLNFTITRPGSTLDSRPATSPATTRLLTADEAAALAGSRMFFYGTPEDIAAQVLQFLQHERERVCTFFHEKREQLLEGVKKLLRSPSPERSRVEDLWKLLVELSRFAELNVEGFRKGIKKHNKTCTGTIPDSFLAEVKEELTSDATGLEEAQRELAALYAKLWWSGDKERAQGQLDSLLREQVNFDRETVWRELVAGAHGKVLEAAPTSLWGRYRQLALVSFAATVLFAVMGSPVFGDAPTAGPKRDCLAVLCSACVLWCSEAVPLFVTGMLIPPLICIFRILVDPSTGQRLQPDAASKIVFASMFSHSICLAMGGFTLAAALSKHLIARRCADAVLGLVGSSASALMFAAMMTTVVGSAVIGNIASCCLVCSLVQPVLRVLPAERGLGRALVAGIAVGGNMGGMVSPIASVHNIIAVNYMTPPGGDAPSWPAWFAVAIPICLVIMVVMWRVLLRLYNIDDESEQELRQLHAAEVPWTPMRIFVSVVSVVTVLMWVANAWLAPVIGGLGVTAFVPLVFLFGFGALDKSNFEQLPWSVVMLAMGGIALGGAVSNCGLLNEASARVIDSIGDSDLWVVQASFSLIAGILVCFISHTVGGMVLLPLVADVGSRIGDGSHSAMLVMATVLMCSGGMALPVSSFPNMITVSQVDALGRPYLSAIDFLKVGSLATVLCWLVVISVGYPLMLAAM